MISFLHSANAVGCYSQPKFGTYIHVLDADGQMKDQDTKEWKGKDINLEDACQQLPRLFQDTFTRVDVGAFAAHDQREFKTCMLPGLEFGVVDKLTVKLWNDTLARFSDVPAMQLLVEGLQYYQPNTSPEPTSDKAKAQISKVFTDLRPTEQEVAPVTVDELGRTEGKLSVFDFGREKYYSNEAGKTVAIHQGNSTLLIDSDGKLQALANEQHADRLLALLKEGKTPEEVDLILCNSPRDNFEPEKRFDGSQIKL